MSNIMKFNFLFVKFASNAATMEPVVVWRGVEYSKAPRASANWLDEETLDALIEARSRMPIMPPIGGEA